MAYRRRRGGLSASKKIRRKRQEKKKIQNALNDIQLAAQGEARERQRATTGTGILGGLIATLIPGLGPAAIAAMYAGGSALGEYAYQQEAFNMDNDSIKEAVNRLESLEDETVFAESREAIEQGVFEGEMTQEQVAGKRDWEDVALKGGTDFMQAWMTVGGLTKGLGKDALKDKNLWSALGEYWSGT